MTDQNLMSVSDLLNSLHWLPQNTNIVSVGSAGDGNMNLVERITLDNGQSLILKRARPWVEKYPHIAAPIERSGVEAAFYRAVKNSPAGEKMPQHLGFDDRHAANLFQDLGEGTDGMNLYQGKVISETDIDAIADWVAVLHKQSLSEKEKGQLSNHAMRSLNATHIFDFPLDKNNGFDLDGITPGLQSASEELKNDAAFVAAVRQVGALYCDENSISEHVLLHGDLYPGSWLTTANGLYIIDPEFCWIGPREWDLGTMLAHLRLSSQPSALSERFLARYGHPVDHELVNKIKGIEIMRRLIGVAQLPLAIDCAAKIALLDEARTLVLGGRYE